MDTQLAVISIFVSFAALFVSIIGLVFAPPGYPVVRAIAGLVAAFWMLVLVVLVAMLLTGTTVVPSTTQTACPPLRNEDADAQSVAAHIGGEAAYWRYEPAYCAWFYGRKNIPATFTHPGGGAVLTYFSGFAEPSNAGGCSVTVPPKSDTTDGITRIVQCPSAGATFQADMISYYPAP